MTEIEMERDLASLYNTYLMYLSYSLVMFGEQ